ncbi:hypothetical protein BU23DRAFT_573001 [Bimuria novae-zelandiae CBS 107.79]|uniref:Uncharacterized protein n=1 Tax=Bimuria novae-zelandiae CBS 107.79 TaxID=1447943 RepID=A0A6A5UV97_9PLEO|nr:hypothetical protein BU23DRAFT_573001 [Bimuria novae-zelandiae CBS 107.79]
MPRSTLDVNGVNCIAVLLHVRTSNDIQFVVRSLRIRKEPRGSLGDDRKRVCDRSSVGHFAVGEYENRGGPSVVQFHIAYIYPPQCPMVQYRARPLIEDLYQRLDMHIPSGSLHRSFTGASCPSTCRIRYSLAGMCLGGARIVTPPPHIGCIYARACCFKNQVYVVLSRAWGQRGTIFRLPPNKEENQHLEYIHV